MCEPISMGIASAVSSFAGQQAAASAQEQAQAQASAAEQVRAQRANTSMRLREAQEGIARSQRQEVAQIKGMEAKSKAKLVALTESGVAGRSLDVILQKLGAEEARYGFSEERQKEMLQQQTTFGMQEEAFRSRMNQLRINQPILQASLLSAGLTGVQTGLGTAQVMQGLFPKTPNTASLPQATPVTITAPPIPKQSYTPKSSLKPPTGDGAFRGTGVLPPANFSNR
jgi:hypothetical protein